ncbi:MAG: hypothetical protein U9N49_12310 [Campylobacterota bacterium]|nr:hypothetical protein [Campylobacterota bacterium]
MEKNVTKTTQGVNINFSGEVEKDKIFKMVENCAHGQCDCMKEDTKRKIKEMKVQESGEGEIKIVLTGDMDIKEIDEAIKRSKVI